MEGGRKSTGALVGRARGSVRSEGSETSCFELGCC